MKIMNFALTGMLISNIFEWVLIGTKYWKVAFGLWTIFFGIFVITWLKVFGD